MVNSITEPEGTGHYEKSLASAPKARNVTAQGNALGECTNVGSAEGAR